LFQGRAAVESLQHERDRDRDLRTSEAIKTLGPLMILTGLLLSAFGMLYVLVAVQRAIDGKPNYALECDMTRTLLLDTKYALILITPGVNLLLTATRLLRKGWPLAILMLAACMALLVLLPHSDFLSCDITN